jgi:hypothetical protein
MVRSLVAFACCNRLDSKISSETAGATLVQTAPAADRLSSIERIDQSPVESVVVRRRATKTEAFVEAPRAQVILLRAQTDSARTPAQQVLNCKSKDRLSNAFALKL